LHGTGWSAATDIALEREEKERKEEKEKSYYNTGNSYLVTHPAEQGLGTVH